MPVTEIERTLVQKDIANHLDTTGPRNWKPLREKHAHVAQSTFWRWVKQVKRGTLRNEHGSTSDKRDKGQIYTRASRASMPHARCAATPDPRIDLLANLERLFEDADALRAYALDKDGAIVLPKIFTAAARFRRELVDTTLRVCDEVWGFRRQQALHDAILGRIGEVSPDLARRVASDLRQLQNDLGADDLRI